MEVVSGERQAFENQQPSMEMKKTWRNAIHTVTGVTYDKKNIIYKVLED